MGFLSKIGNIAKSATENFITAVAHPVSYVSQTLKTGTAAPLVQKHISEPLGKQILQTAVSVGSAAALVSGVGTASSMAKAGTLAKTTSNLLKSAIPKTLTGKAAVAIATPVAIGAVAGNPIGAAKTISNAPQAAANFGYNLAKVGSNPTLENVKEIAKENPLLTGAAVTALVAPLAIKAIPSLINLETSREVKKELKNLADMPDMANTKQEQILTTPTDTQKELPIVTNQGTPQTPQTQTISPNITRPRKKYSKRHKITSMSQKVNVIVSNTGVKNSYSKRYINNEIYA